MNDLETPKNDFFRVPQNYFEDLPQRIQHRMESRKQRGNIQAVVWRYAAACFGAVALIVAASLYSHSPKADAESILASVETADLLQYLQESDVTTDELLDNSDFTEEELQAIEIEAFMFDSAGDEALPDLN